MYLKSIKKSNNLRITTYNYIYRAYQILYINIKYKMEDFFYEVDKELLNTKADNNAYNEVSFND